MDRFASHDGTEIAFRILGEGRPLVCLPGGPGRAGEGISERSRAVRDSFFADGPFHPDATRAALSGLAAPVLVYAGELDFSPTPEVAVDAARLFPHGEVVVQPEAGHSPWLDDPVWFTSAVNTFLGTSPGQRRGVSDGRLG